MNQTIVVKWYNKLMSSKTTDQVRTPPNPTGKGGFGDNPQNRNPGGWKKEDTPRYKLEQMMKLSKADLQEVIDDTSAPLFEQKLAKAIQEGRWHEIKEMIQEVYGKPKESVDLTSKGQKLNVAMVEFVNGSNKDQDTTS